MNGLMNAWRVVCGLSVTIETFSPTTRFTNVDFPEFGRPMIETNPDLLMGLGSECLQSQSLYSPPVGCEYFDFNSSMFNLLSWGREFSKKLDDGAGYGCAVRIGNEGHTKFFFDCSKFQSPRHNIDAFRLLYYFFAICFGLIVDFTHDLFKQILHGDQARN